MSKSEKAGFTLIELLVVITIIAILAALLLPTLLGAMCSSRIASANAVINELSKALEEYNSYFGSYPPTDITGDVCPCRVTINSIAHTDNPTPQSLNMVYYLQKTGPRSIPLYSFKFTDIDAGGNFKSNVTPTGLFSYKENADVLTANKTKAHNPYKYDIYADDCNGVLATKVKNW